MSFAQRIAEGTTRQNIFLVTGGNDSSGRAAWYYVEVDAAQKARFQRSVKSGALNLSEYGTIVRSGYGATPPDTVRQFMKNNYGFEG